MITLVFGTRPEAIKVGPIAAELRAADVEFRIICTTQHTDLLRGTPAETDLGGAQQLNMPSTGNVLRWVHNATKALKSVLADADLVVVQGDTMSAMAGAKAAHSLMRPLAHVEAGIRSHNMYAPWPEEGFRVEIDRLADWYYAPTTTAYANLVAEGAPPERIRVTGNTGVSALARYTEAVPSPASDHIVVTLHRREWLNGPEFPQTVFALADAVRTHAPLRFIWPVHPAVAARLPPRWIKRAPMNMVIMPPLPYPEAARLIAHATGVLTDSGGVQEEAATLGVPCAVLRHVTDRPESIEAGVAGRFDPDGDGIVAACQALAEKKFPRTVAPVFGDATAASQIVHHLASLFVSC